MKTLPFSLKLMTLLLCSFLAASCSDDDDDEPELNNQLEYDNKKYDLTMAYTAELGPVGFENTDTHFGQAFVVNDYDETTETGEVVLGLYLFSAGATGFQTGTFEFADLSVANSATIYSNKSFFFESYFGIDSNADQQLDEDTEIFEINGGTVQVSGMSPNYTIEADVDLENGKGVKVKYKGDFMVVPLSDDDGAATGQRKLPSATPFRLKAPKSFYIN